MFSIYIMLIVAIAMTAALGFGILSLIKTAETSLGVQKNQTRMATISASIRSYVRTDGDDVLIPIEVNDSPDGNFVARIPGFAPFSTTVWGGEIVYCPVSPSDATGTGTVTNAHPQDDDESYDVDFTTEGTVTYITAGGPATADLTVIRNNGVIAMLLAPGPNSDGGLRCSDVELADDGQTLLISGGSVTVISDIPAETDGKTFVLSSGNYSGSRKVDASMIVGGFSDITSYLEGYGTRDVEIMLPSQDSEETNITHYVSTADLTALLNAAEDKTIRLTGDGAGARLGVDIDDGSEADLEWEAVIKGKLVVSNVEIEGYEVDNSGETPVRTRTADAGLSVAAGGELVTENTSVSHLIVNGGEATLSEGSRIRPEHGTSNFEIPVRVTGGRLVVDPADNATERFLEAVTATNAILVSGGSADFVSSFHALLGSGTERLVLATDGGTISRASPSVTASVTRASVTQTESIPVLPEVVTVDNTCADDDDTCSVMCPDVTISSSDPVRETFLAWGECSSTDGAAIAGTATGADRKSFTCAWQLPAAVEAPTAKAFCEIR